VIAQVGYYRWRRRRLLRCAPLHHHFQFLGWTENKIVVRFWIASALCALLGAASLKMDTTDGMPGAGKQEFPNRSDGRYVYQQPRIARMHTDKIETSRLAERTSGTEPRSVAAPRGATTGRGFMLEARSRR
jgi:hypothetical protein